MSESPRIYKRALLDLAETEDLQGWSEEVLKRYDESIKLEIRDPGELSFPQTRDDIAAAMEAFTTGEELVAGRWSGTEQIIDEELPVFPIVEDFPTVSPRDFRLPEQELVSSSLKTAVRATGRINFLDDEGYVRYATGFLVTPDLVCTNRHVASAFCTGVGLQNLSLTSSANIHFGMESGSNWRQGDGLPTGEQGEVYDIEGPVLIHPYWDVAFLSLESSSERLPLAFDASGRKASKVFVVGHPQPSSSAGGYNHQLRLLDREAGVKRVAPGKVGPRTMVVDPQGNSVLALTHKASTLPSNSGSPLIRVDSGEVLGIHMSGRYLVDNYAVPASELFRDPRIVELGLSFEPDVSVTDPWSDYWERTAS